MGATARSGAAAATAAEEAEAMAVKEVRPGLYERTDTPRDAKITREFVESVRKHSGSIILQEIMEDAVREQESRQHPDSKALP